MFPELSLVEEVIVVNDDALGLPTTSIVFCLTDGSTQSFRTKSEHRAAVGWFERNLPEFATELARLVKPGVMENAETRLYKRGASPL